MSKVIEIEVFDKYIASQWSDTEIQIRSNRT